MEPKKTKKPIKKPAKKKPVKAKKVNKGKRPELDKELYKETHPKGGRPPMYQSAEQLQERIDEYFESGMKIKQVVVGNKDKREVINVPVPTLTGLVLFLGFESRQSFFDMEKVPAFSYTIKKARMRVESVYEEMLATGAPVGAIFALKNMGWKDKTEVENTVKLGNDIDYSKLSDAALKEITDLMDEN